MTGPGDVAESQCDRGGGGVVSSIVDQHRIRCWGDIIKGDVIRQVVRNILCCIFKPDENLLLSLT